ncbi:MAG: anaerobic ribonucleoside-triphosphate reductase activating protein [Treponema sp.]|nr:anaerobic ribonucleoside-triphosphate reductase activating protein [Treponema sp.]
MYTTYTVDAMKISLRKTSLVDYPGKIAGALFFPGCNLRCPWCHNRELVLFDRKQMDKLVAIDDVLRYLEKRRPVLGGVVLSGGESTLYRELPSLIRRIKKLGLSVKIDTNGMNPGMLEQLVHDRDTMPDYIALDLKVAPRRYALLALHNPGDPAKKLEESAALIRSSPVPHEFRTLVFPREFITPLDIESLAPLVDDAPWYFRLFRPGNCLDPAWDNLEPAELTAAQALAERAQALGKQGIYAGK